MTIYFMLTSQENLFLIYRLPNMLFVFMQVHFDCLYRGVTAVSSRESKLLAGNRIIAQVIYSLNVILIQLTTSQCLGTPILEFQNALHIMNG